MMFIKSNIDFFQKSDNCVRYSGRFKNYKNARENVLIEKKYKRYMCSSVICCPEKHKMGRLTLTDRCVAIGLIQAGVSKQEVGLHFPLFLAND